MTPQDIELLKIYVPASPFLVFALALGVVWLTGWMDRHERKRHPAESARLHVGFAADVACLRSDPGIATILPKIFFVAAAQRRT